MSMRNPTALDRLVALPLLVVPLLSALVLALLAEKAAGEKAELRICLSRVRGGTRVGALRETGGSIRIGESI